MIVLFISYPDSYILPRKREKDYIGSQLHSDNISRTDQYQDGRDDDERHYAHGHQQHQPGRRGEAQEDVAKGPPTAWETLSARDNSGGHSLHQDS